MSSQDSSRQQFFLLQVIPSRVPQEEADARIHEAEQLIATYGGDVVDVSIQHADAPNPATYIGKGKVAWLIEVVKREHLDVVVVNDIVNSGQLFRLEKALWEGNRRIAVWDRVDLILNIFEKHATSTPAKLQIELARLEHIGPRIYGLGGTVLSRQGGGIGTRGIGETNAEIERQKMKKLKQKIQQQLARYTLEQEKRMQRRKLQGITTVALIGYTSAGKTTLFNALTRKEKRTDQGLFTTLDSVVGKLKIAPFAPTVLLSDTIGFIENLPPFLIEAFRSTLLESVEATLILHVVDSTDPKMEEKIRVVEEILKELSVTQTPVFVFNKIDRASAERRTQIAQRYGDRRCFFISAKMGTGIDALRALLKETFITPVSS